jgi:hypothetical protein
VLRQLAYILEIDVIITQGASVSEETEFRRSYHVESTVPIRSRTEEIMCYRGRREDPKWLDIEPCA